MSVNLHQFPQITPVEYQKARSQILSGDILLCSGSSIFSTLIKKATNSIWSHVAFIIRLDIIDRVMVLESVESIGVRTVPLSSYVENYNGTGKSYPGQILIARHQQFNYKNIKNLSKKAVDLFGYPYNMQEILRIATCIGLKKSFGLSENTLPNSSERAFICSEYAYECYRSLGITIEYDPAGFVSPADFAKTPLIDPVFALKTNST